MRQGQTVANTRFPEWGQCRLDREKRPDKDINTLYDTHDDRGWTLMIRGSSLPTYCVPVSKLKVVSDQRDMNAPGLSGRRYRGKSTNFANCLRPWRTYDDFQK
jgi:hypothetical protein